LEPDALGAFVYEEMESVAVLLGVFLFPPADSFER
jgi:hypothetical protein